MKSLNYDLGFFVGEYIINKFLPTLSISMIRTNITIPCTIGEADEYNRLNDLWYEEYQKNKDDNLESWVKLREFYTKLQTKYLPHELKCYVYKINPSNMKKFKLGIIDSLWGSDACSYSLSPEDIEVDYDDYSTIIIFKLDVNS